jgi:hypothetical protein
MENWIDLFRGRGSLTIGPAINEIPECAIAAQPSTQIPAMTYIKDHRSGKGMLQLVDLPVKARNFHSKLPVLLPSIRKSPISNCR